MIASQLPVFYCSDQRVQRFIDRWMHDFPLVNEEPQSAYDIFTAARERYGDLACWDAIIRLH